MKLPLWITSRRAPRQGHPHKSGLLLQWHVTERCNLRCAHCYQTQYSGPELGFKQLLDVLEQYRELLQVLHKDHGFPPRGQITVTGGEPFVRKDFSDLLEVFAANRAWFRFAILTNGSIVDEARARMLSRLRPRFVQVSIEGTQATHDAIRARGDFERTVAAVRRLVRHGVRTLISFTAHRLNFREFPAVAELGHQLGVASVWSDRLIPYGSGAAVAGQALTPAETQELFVLMRQARQQVHARPGNRTEISMNRALQFLEGGRCYRCTAGDTLITLMPNGDLYPCRRMPIRSGNVLEKPLSKLYFESDLLRRLRDPKGVSSGCEGCGYRGACRGGLKCLSYATTGDPFTADPGCWLASGVNQEPQLAPPHNGPNRVPLVQIINWSRTALAHSGAEGGNHEATL